MNLYILSVREVELTRVFFCCRSSMAAVFSENVLKVRYRYTTSFNYSEGDSINDIRCNLKAYFSRRFRFVVIPLPVVF